MKSDSELTSLSNTFTYFNGFRMPFESWDDDLYSKVWTDSNGFHFNLIRHNTDNALEAISLLGSDYKTYAVKNDYKVHIEYKTEQPYLSRNYFYKFHQSDNACLYNLSQSLQHATKSQNNYLVKPIPYSYSDLQYFFINMLNFYEKFERDIGSWE